MRSIWNDLKATGHDIKESEVVRSVLAGLPKEYETMVGSLEASEKELGLDDVLSKLLNVEQRVNHQEEQEAAYIAQGYKETTARVQDLQTSPSTTSTNDPASTVRRSAFITRRRATSKPTAARGLPMNRRQAPTRALMAIKYVEEDDKDLWALDSGSTKHISPHKRSCSRTCDNQKRRSASRLAASPRRRHMALETSS